MFNEHGDKRTTFNENGDQRTMFNENGDQRTMFNENGDQRTIIICPMRTATVIIKDLECLATLKINHVQLLTATVRKEL